MENLGWWMTATQVNPSSVAICGALKQATRAPTSIVSCGTHAMGEQAMASTYVLQCAHDFRGRGAVEA